MGWKDKWEKIQVAVAYAEAGLHEEARRVAGADSEDAEKRTGRVEGTRWGAGKESLGTLPARG